MGRKGDHEPPIGLGSKRKANAAGGSAIASCLATYNRPDLCLAEADDSIYGNFYDHGDWYLPTTQKWDILLRAFKQEATPAGASSAAGY
jgi:hypothetical protein